MSDRFLARGWGAEELDSEAEMEAFFKAHFTEMIAAIGGSLDRMQAMLQRMERDLEACSS